MKRIVVRLVKHDNAAIRATSISSPTAAGASPTTSV